MFLLLKNGCCSKKNYCFVKEGGCCGKRKSDRCGKKAIVILKKKQ